MKTVNDKVNEIKKSGKLGLMGHVIAGYPSLELSKEAAFGVCEGGADFLEIQFPFSDPAADGPTIEQACYHSLNNGFKVEDGFNMVKELAFNTETAILIMTYGNIFYKYGAEKFIKKASEMGASGVIIPDIPPESDEGLLKVAKDYNISVIFLSAPATPIERVKYLSNIGSGFLYTIVRRGITGKKTDINDEVIERLKLVRQNSSLPIAAAFGIQTKEQVKLISKEADIVVVGSHFVKKITKAHTEKKDIRKSLKEAVEELLS